MRKCKSIPTGVLLTFQTHAWTDILRLKRSRTELAERLLAAGKRHSVPILNYLALPDSVAVLAIPETLEAASALVGHVRGTLAASHARRTDRPGPFWQGRVRYTLVQGEAALQGCVLALAMGPVASEQVLHPCEYRWSGYAELVGLRRRYRILDHARLRALHRCEGDPELHAHIAERTETATNGTIAPVCQWASHLAVGAGPWIQAAAEAIPRPFRKVTAFGDTQGDGTITAITTSEPNRRHYLPRLFRDSDLLAATSQS